MISGKTIIKKKSNLLSTIIDKEVVVLGIDSGNYFGFNKIGSDIWNNIDQPVKVDNLISDLEFKYADDNDDIKSDVITFLEILQEQGLIELIDEDKS